VRAWEAVASIALIVTSNVAHARDNTISVGAGKVIRVWTYGNVQKDCSTEGGIIKVHTRPQHGKITQQPGLTVIGSWTRYPEQVPCRGKTTNGIHVYYVSDPNFHGTDSFSIEVIYPGHPTDIDTFTMNVQ
jgi:hypothetical protein